METARWPKSFPKVAQMKNLERLPAIYSGKVHVVVEASRGMTAKCKYDPERGLFVLGKPLPHGLVYPYDWGFIPGTLGDDGDPLDALVLHDAACPVGCLIECNPVAVLEIEQQEKGKKPQRNDRFLLIPNADKAIKKDILTGRLKRELEQFFRGIVLGSGKTLNLLDWKGAGASLKAIRRSAARHANGRG
jgi:inorganic pyrophosphatase